MTSRYFYKALVNRIKDGDSIELIVDLGMNITYLVEVRFNGMDTPEIYKPNTPLERQAGLLVTEHLKQMIEGKEVYIKTFKNSKYGDYLAEVYLNEDDKISINQLFLSEGLSREYNGDKKTPWTTEQLNLIINKLTIKV